MTYSHHITIMKLQLPKYLLLILFLALISCSNTDKTKSKTVVQKTIPNGIITTVISEIDRTQSYQIYLPSYYSASRKFPIIVVFDPHGDGTLAVSKFKNIAETYGYIIVGSNNIRNGLKTINPSINALFQDFLARFSVDKTRIYTAGFSGGAKVASSIAFYKGGIAGVISCGSGFDQMNQQLDYQFDLVSIVGLQDFSYQQVNKLHIALREFNFSEQLLFFDGKHTWAPEASLQEAVEWLELMAMKRKLIPIDDNKIRRIQTSWAQEINTFNNEGKYYSSYLAYARFISSFNGLYSMSDYIENFKQISKHPQVKKSIDMEQKIAMGEVKAQRIFLDAFQSKDQSWWRTELNKLRIRDVEPLIDNMRQRLLAYNSMAAYVYVDNYLNARNFDASKRYLDLYKLIDPENPDILYFESCLFAMQNRQDQALVKLKEAITKGFSDNNLLQTDERLNSIRNTIKFKELYN